ncbi:hypothetical protein GALMADRAFT_720477 [Galerina marginata CBS 339.88]|uniref:Uncharacterized protein n=1 Tax=Galerina marginata (strain CBS 339.88) TaxID=685588 RepID=A0A067TQS1_GALM3|nr:hypothetical protein GALMADRAFT_720477 [Galerina marginata CBS 339.88]
MSFALVEFFGRINGVRISYGVNPMYPGGLARPERAPVLREWVLHPSLIPPPLQVA